MGGICQSIYLRFVWRILPVNAVKVPVNITLLIQRIKLFMMYAMAQERYPTIIKKIIESPQLKKIFAQCVT